MNVFQKSLAQVKGVNETFLFSTLKYVVPFVFVTLVIFCLLVFTLQTRQIKSTENQLHTLRLENSQLLSEINKKRINNNIENGMELIASGSASYARNHYLSLNELKSQLTAIFAGQFEYIPKTIHPDYPVSYFQKEIDLTYVKYSEYDTSPHETRRQIIVSAYKYIPGAVVDSGYEGSKWKVDMDAWVNYLRALSPSTKKIKKVTWWGMDEKENPIVVKRLSNYTFGIYDDSFKPGGTKSRRFVTYDSVHGNIIEIEARDFFIPSEYQKDSALHKYTTDVEGFFSSVEDAIANLNL